MILKIYARQFMVLKIVYARQFVSDLNMTKLSLLSDVDSTDIN